MQSIIIDGKEFPSINACCKAYDMPIHYFARQRRKDKGLSNEECFSQSYSRFKTIEQKKHDEGVEMRKNLDDFYFSLRREAWDCE